MAISDEFKTFAEDLFAGFGAVKIREMFGGCGIYRDGVMFAIIARETLYLKADEENRSAFEAEGKGPFVYETKGKTATMSYWEIPERLYDDVEEFADWASRAYEAALRSRAKK